MKKLAANAVLLWTAYLLPATFGASVIPTVVKPLNIGVPNTISDVATKDSPSQDDYRIPDYINPSRYQIVIKPDFTASGEVYTFSGEVTIRASYTVSTRRITLHAGNNLHLYSVRLIDAGNGNSIDIQSTERDEEREFLHINTEFGALISRSILIQIGFTGTFSPHMEGFYKTYFTEGGKERVLLATHFEPTKARNAFPCLDEPAYKTNFHLTIYAPKGYGALSNTPLDKTASVWSNSEGTKFVFKETPKMSPHLLAFLVYPVDAYGPTPFGVTTLSEVTIFSWSLKSDIEAGRAQWGLLSTPPTLTMLEEYLGASFVFENITKVDQAVVPAYRHQATENWGLVQFNADRLLVDPEEGTELDKEAVAEHVADELAHAWFGDRVSPEWWDCAWLSAAIDEVLQEGSVAQQHNDWRLDERLAVDRLQNALALDATSASLPLTHAINTPKEIAKQLTPFVRNKGASIMQMIRNLVGDNALRSSLRSFLEDNSGSFKNGIVNPSHLGAALEKNKPNNVSLDLRTFLTLWTETAGYPVITVLREYDSGDAVATQERFLYDSTSKPLDQYYVPLTAISGGRTQQGYLFPGNESIKMTDLSADEWLLLEKVGYYRVNYDDNNWDLLIKTLESNPNALSPSSRAHLLDDALALARGGRLAYSRALRLFALWHQETDFVAWAAALPNMRFLDRALAHADADGALKKFTLYILSAVYPEVAWSGGVSHLHSIMQSYVLRAACKAGDPSCLANSKEQLKEYLHGEKKPDPNSRDAVVCYGVQEGAAAEWEAVAALLAEKQVESERRAVIKGLGCSPDADTLKGYLKRAISEDDLKPYEKPSVFTAVYANTLGVDIALDSLISDFDAYLDSFGERVLGTLIEDLAQHLNTDQQVSKLQQLSLAHPGVSEISSALSTASDNVLWLQMYADEVISALKELTPVSTTQPLPSTTPTTPGITDPPDPKPSPSLGSSSYLGLVIAVLAIIGVMVFSSVLVIVEYKKGTYNPLITTQL